MKIATTIIAIALCSCSGAKYFSKPSVHDDFKPSLERLKSELNKRGLEPLREKITIRYEDPGVEGAAAACYPMGNLIKVRPDYADRPQSHKDLIILHEIGHCWFGLPHVGGNDRIMSPGGFTEELKNDPWRSEYIEKYFNLIEKQNE